MPKISKGCAPWQGIERPIGTVGECRNGKKSANHGAKKFADPSKSSRRAFQAAIRQESDGIPAVIGIARKVLHNRQFYRDPHGWHLPRARVEGRWLYVIHHTDLAWTPQSLRNFALPEKMVFAVPAWRGMLDKRPSLGDNLLLRLRGAALFRITPARQLFRPAIALGLVCRLFRRICKILWVIRRLLLRDGNVSTIEQP